MVKIGDTFQLVNRDIDIHLHIVVSDPNINSDQIVTVNFTSWREDKDQSCIVEISEHRYIKKRSCVDYRDKIISREDYEKVLSSNLIALHDRISDDLLKRILYGAEISPFLSFGSRKILVDQGLIDL